MKRSAAAIATPSVLDALGPELPRRVLLVVALDRVAVVVHLGTLTPEESHELGTTLEEAVPRRGLGSDRKPEVLLVEVS